MASVYTPVYTFTARKPKHKHSCGLSVVLNFLHRKVTAPIAPASYDRRDWVTPEALNVAPALLGMPLARPTRRAAAMLIDLAVVALVAAAANLWWLAALVASAVGWEHARRRGSPMRRRWPWWLAAAVLAGAGLWQTARDAASPPPPSATGDAVDHALAEAQAPGVSAASLEDRLRIVVLEAEVARLRAREHEDWRAMTQRWVEELGLGYGWALVYFAWLPARWNGQTLGKRLLGLRMMELSGRPVTLMLCLKRFGGYAAGMATGGLGFLQVWWDPNRQALQDRAAHTVVVDLRRARRLDLAAPPPAGTRDLRSDI